MLKTEEGKKEGKGWKPHGAGCDPSSSSGEEQLVRRASMSLQPLPVCRQTGNG